MDILFILTGLTVGGFLGWFMAKSKTTKLVENERQTARQRYTALELDFTALKVSSQAEAHALNEKLLEKQAAVEQEHVLVKEQANRMAELSTALTHTKAQWDSTKTLLNDKEESVEKLKKELSEATAQYNDTNRNLAEVLAENRALKEKLETQKAEIEELGKKINLEFEHIANKILESKTEKFTELNKTNLKAILDPFGENIDAFKKVVNDVYVKESNERFSLGKHVKELAELNQQISKEARDLTRALKGEVKTQGRWGEIILETILEKSGLRKNEEYFMEYQLRDMSGVPMRSDSEGKKMRPDAMIKYPDNRNVIIDSKVSLNAFTRYIDATDADEQKKELAAHVAAVKAHIVALSTKGYDDFNQSLDFVMMFIPSEPAYIAAVQGDPDIWNFAYDKRILLLNPTNLITSLKLIVDLWKREKYNKNALDIAERGAKMYDKLVGFVSNLQEVGKNLDKAHQAYQDSYKQLATGSDNLVLQAQKMKALGVKAKKSLSEELVQNASLEEIPEQEES